MEAVEMNDKERGEFLRRVSERYAEMCSCTVVEGTKPFRVQTPGRPGRAGAVATQFASAEEAVKLALGWFRPAAGDNEARALLGHVDEHEDDPVLGPDNKPLTIANEASFSEDELDQVFALGRLLLAAEAHPNESAESESDTSQPFTWRKERSDAAELGYLVEGSDPAEAARNLALASARHDQVERSYAKFLIGLGYEVRWKSEEGEPAFDIAATKEGESFLVAEVKTINSENQAHQIRLGIGQLLDYRRRFKVQGDGPDFDLRLVVDREPVELSKLHASHWSKLASEMSISLVVHPVE